MNCLNALTNETGILVKDRKWIFERANVKADFVIFPSFFNAHTHIGDSIIEAPKKDLEELVGQRGLKFRVLEEAEEDEIVNGMKKSVDLISKTSATALEFREGGIEGYNLYRKADESGVLIALSRPNDEFEAEELIKISHGFGFSSVRDHNLDFLEYCRDITRKNEKIFAIHAGERDDEDVEDALAMEPDFLIHMNMASERNLKRAIDLEIPIVTCFRSNAFFGLFNIKNYEILSDYENWMIGTDNAMVSTPSMLDEVRFASYFMDYAKVFQASIRNPFFQSYTIARIDKINRRNPIASIVRRLESCDIVRVIREEIVFR